MLKPWKIIKNEKGEGMFYLPFILFFILIFVYMSIDLFGYMNTKSKLNTAVNETLEIVKSDNGFDQSTHAFFMNFASKLGLNVSQLEVNGTSKIVQRGMPVEVFAKTVYEVRALRPFGHIITMDVSASASGLAQTFIR